MVSVDTKMIRIRLDLLDQHDQTLATVCWFGDTLVDAYLECRAISSQCGRVRSLMDQESKASQDRLATVALASIEAGRGRSVLPATGLRRAGTARRERAVSDRVVERRKTGIMDGIVGVKQDICWCGS